MKVKKAIFITQKERDVLEESANLLEEIDQELECVCSDCNFSVNCPSYAQREIYGLNNCIFKNTAENLKLFVEYFLESNEN